MTPLSSNRPTAPSAALTTPPALTRSPLASASSVSAEGSTIYSGSDSSAAYSLVVVPENRLAAVKIQYGDGMVEIPVYPDETVTGGVKVALPSGERGEIPLGDPDDALASGPIYTTYEYTYD